MSNQSKSVCVIPARGGSKRIPGKNIRPFCGKPMIAWSIEAAQKSGLFEMIVVSTDSREIADVAEAAGASVPFFRPADISGDFATTFDVMRHAIRELLSEDEVAALCCLYATAPFVTERVLREGYEILTQNACDFVLAVTSFPHPIERALRVRDERLELLNPAMHSVRSQDAVEAFHDAGQFCWGTASSFTNRPNVMSSHVRALILPRYRVQDIDTDEDWIRAELMHAVIRDLP